MQPALLIRLRPAGPWRYGSGGGGDDTGNTATIDPLFRSDRLFSAVTLAMRQLGWLEEWLEATARAERPAVALSSLFPYQADTLYAPPPATAWPPAPSLVTTSSPVFLSKIRWSAARFVPVGLIESILMGQSVLAEQWTPDAESGCLLRRDRPSTSPFRMMTRSGAAVDRAANNAVHVHSSACVQFEPGSGLWCLARFDNSATESEWRERVEASFRLLADTGFGGRRSSGWGHSEAPQFQQGGWPNLLLPKLARAARNGNNGAETSLYWILSLYSPAQKDGIDWSGGEYQLTTRGGHVESASGLAAKKKAVRMIAEGSVLAARDEPMGTAVDVAPDGFPHPVYRAGFAIAFRLPGLTTPDIQPVEMPTDEEAPEPRPCAEPVSQPEEKIAASAESGHEV